MEIVKDEYGYIFKDEDMSESVDVTAYAVMQIKKPITNADRIRGYTDEELAAWLERIRLCCATDLCGRSCTIDGDPVDNAWSYCPECGSKMTGVERLPEPPKEG